MTPIKRFLVRSTCAIALCSSAFGVALPARAASAYTLITEPADNYQQIYSLINGAGSTVDMTMYELADTTAEQDLVADAQRGVTVRVILDTNLEKSNNTDAYNYLTANGVHVVWAATGYAATHQKTITVDGKTSAILSGNLTSRYYATSRDFAVIDRNQVDVGAIEKVFAADFQHQTITPGDGDNLVWSPTDAQSKLVSLIGSATKTLDVENEEMGSSVIVKALVAAANRGVAVHVTMNVDSDYNSEFDTLTAAGVQVHQYVPDKPLYIHAKVIVADAATSSHRAYVGSINFSSYSMTKNRELGIITTDAGVDSGAEQQLSADFGGGSPYQA